MGSATQPSVRARAVEAHARAVCAAVVVPDLGELVTRYQDLLRLRDWRIDVSYLPDLVDSRGRPVWGLCYPTVDARVATIEIRDPNTPPAGVTPEAAAKQVVETVVHELVHLHFAPFGNASPAEIAAEEQAVWALAEALIRSAGTPEESTIARAMVVAIDKTRIKGKASVGPAQSDVVSAVGAALRTRFPQADDDMNGPWVQDVFATSVVYQLTGALYELAYTFDGSVATLGAEPTRVIRSYSPAPAQAEPVARVAKSRAAKANGESPMPALSQKLIAMLIEAAATGDKKVAPIASAVLAELLGATPAEADKPSTEEPAAEPAPAAPAAAARVVAPEAGAEAAFGRAVMSIVGIGNPTEALAEIARRTQVVTNVETREADVARDRQVVDAIEATERKALVASLVKLEVETPATAWADATASAPCARLTAEPIAELRARVAAMTASKRPAARLVPPASTDAEDATPEELAKCAAKDIDPKKYLATRAGIRARNAGAAK